MSAADSVASYLDWAGAPAGPPPLGDLHDADRLAAATDELGAALGAAIRRYAARQQLAQPPFGAEGGHSGDALLLAFALTQGSGNQVAWWLISRMRACWHNLAEALARHVVLEPALTYLAPLVIDAAIRASPLTAVLLAPMRGQSNAAVELADLLLATGDGRALLRRSLAVPHPDPAVLRWRGELLGRLRGHSAGHRAFVLDVYETAMVHHEAELMESMARAFAILGDPEALSDSAKLDWAVAWGRWWGPLAAIARSHNDLLRDRRYLGYEFRRGLALHQTVSRMMRPRP